MKTLTIVVTIATLAACASQSPSVASTPSAVRHRPGQLTRAELEPFAGHKLGEAIRMIDPGLLMNRGEAVQVWVDGSSYTTGVLESLSVNDVQQVERVSASDARQRFGDRATGAGLVIRTRSR